jgi:hypothetical protein
MATFFDTPEDLMLRRARIEAAERALAATPSTHPLRPHLVNDIEQNHLELWNMHNQPPSYWHALHQVETTHNTFDEKVRSLIRLWLGLWMAPGYTEDARQILEESELLLLHIVREAQVQAGQITDADHAAMLEHADAYAQGGWRSGFYDPHPDAIWQDVQQQQQAYGSATEQRLYPLDHWQHLEERLQQVQQRRATRSIAPRLQHEHAVLSTLHQLSRPGIQPIRRRAKVIGDMLRSLENAWYALIAEPLNIERQTQVRTLTHQLLALIRGSTQQDD